jgi:hypothetical protein
MRKFNDQLNITEGFVYAQGKLSQIIPGSILEGLNVMPRGEGLIESVGSAGATGLTGYSKSMLVGSGVGGVSGSGNVVIGPGGSLWGIGSGTGNGAGTSLTLSSALQFIRNSTLYTAGLNAPGAGSIASPSAADPLATKVSGSYSIKFTKKRTATGIESNAGPNSNVVNTKGSDNKHHKLKVTQPAVSQVFDVFGAYVTLRNFGARGPHFWFNDIPINWNGSPAIDGLQSSGVAGIWYLDINDSDLNFNITPPTDHFPPDSGGGTFFFFLGNVAVIVGTFGGTGISPSIPGVYEAFPPSYTTFLPEPPVGVRGRATDGWVYILGANSINAAIFSGSKSTPIVPRTIYPDVGVANGQAAAMVGSGLYFFSLGRGALRTNGDSNEPDSSFAWKVAQYFADNNWGANVVVGYDPHSDAVVFANGSIALAYVRHLDQWSTPINLGMTPTSAVTHNGALYFSDGGQLFRFGSGSVVGNWYCIPVWANQFPQKFKIITLIQGSGSNGVVVDLIGNLNTGAILDTLTLNGSHTDPLKTYIKDVRSYTVKVSGTAAAQRLEDLIIEGLVTPMRV